jgi:hypothetical protein
MSSTVFNFPIFNSRTARGQGQFSIWQPGNFLDSPGGRSFSISGYSFRLDLDYRYHAYPHILFLEGPTNVLL